MFIRIRNDYACPVNYHNPRAYYAQITGYQRVTSNEVALLKVVSRQRVSATLDGYGPDFRMYYMRIRRNVGYLEGLCGIASDASYPV